MGKLNIFPKSKEPLKFWPILTFWIAKETINKMKRQPREQEKKIANYVTDKDLISRIYKQLI